MTAFSTDPAATLSGAVAHLSRRAAELFRHRPAPRPRLRKPTRTDRFERSADAAARLHNLANGAGLRR